MLLGCISTAEVCLLIPLIIFIGAIALRFIYPIQTDRIIVRKYFPLYVFIYVAVTCACIIISTRFVSSDTDYNFSTDNRAWTHFFAPGYAISDKDSIWYFRTIDILGILTLNVLLITTLINSLSRLREKYKAGLLYYNHSLYGICCKKNVVVVVGNHESVFEIVRQSLARGGERKPNYVLVLMEGNIGEYRSQMKSIVPQKDYKKIILCKGSLTSSLDLRNIHIEKASEVFVVGNKTDQNGGASVHDAECIKCIRLLRGVKESAKDGEKKGIVTASSRKKQETLFCRVFFEYQTSYTVFQTADIVGEESHEIEGEKNLRRRVLAFKPMNFYEQSCEKALGGSGQENEYYIPLDGKDGIQEKSDEFVHLIIVGQTQMGTALAIEAAQLAHYPNFHRKENGKRIGPRTRITFIDENADLEKDYFMGRLKSLFELSPWRYRDLSQSYSVSGWIYPMDNVNSPFHDGHIGKDFIDVEWEFIKGNIASPAIKEYLESAVREENAKCTLAICYHDQNISVAAAQYLPDEISQKFQEILVYQKHEESVIDEMKDYDESGRFENYRSFGSINKFYDDKQCYDRERYFDKDLTIFDPKKSKPKSQIACWWSDRYRELTTETRLRCFGIGRDDFKQDNTFLEAYAKVEHARWNMEQLLLGFRPLTTDEQLSCSFNSKDTKAEKEAKQEIKGKLKKQKAHLDICSCERLKEIDNEVVKYDHPSYQHSLQLVLDGKG